MKSARRILVMSLAVMAFVACQKEDGVDRDGYLKLTVEGMNGGNKMAIDGVNSYWADGDVVNINGQECPVVFGDGGGAYTEASDFDDAAAFYGVYPASIYASNVGNSYTLTLPAEYTYATTEHNGTKQNLQSPMVAYALPTATELQFKHLTAAITVEVKNDFGIDVRVTNVTISSNKYKLHGSVTVDVTSDLSSIVAVESATASDRQVEMNFTGTPCVIASGATKQVQLPILPVGDDNRFTISVTVQNVDDAAMEYTFTKTQGDSQAAYALGRAKMGFAPAKFGGTYVINAAGDEIRFAPGNLQYIGSAATPYWKFATHQYDYIGSAQGDAASNLDRDLFGWGTSGYDNTANDAFAINYSPYSTSESGATYSSDAASAYQNNRYGYGPSVNMSDLNLTGSSANYDWGWNNAISNGGNVTNRWRTLSKDEFSYVLNTRATSFRIGYTSTRYIYACLLGSYHGIIILPSDYVHPDGISAPVYGTSGWSSNAYTAAEWAKMEVAGAVFLPAAGQRKGTAYSQGDEYGNYWTTTYANVSNAQYYYFSSAKVGTTSQYRYYGYSVRLVRDVE